MSRAKSKEQIASDERVALGQIRTEAAAQVASRALAIGGIVAVAYFVFRIVAALAGLRTYAQISVGILGDLRVAASIAWGGTAAATSWAVWERKLRRDTIERLTKRTQELEQQIDSRRSSSKLTPRGDTNPSDRL